MRAVWSIPGVGAVHPRIDRVVIVSTAPVGFLKKYLPISALKQASHAFEVHSYGGPDPRLRSRIVMVGAGTSAPLTLLKQHKHRLGRYRITLAELAFDVKASTVEDAHARFLALIALLDKPWHRRRHLRSIQIPNAAARPAGYLPDFPTIYYEERRSSVAMKWYGRREKLAGGAFGQDLCVRLEWTLKGIAALRRHLGGNKIDDLLTADLNAFLKRNLRLRRVDYVALGKLFCGAKITRPPHTGKPGPHRAIIDQWDDPDYRAWRAAFLFLRVLGYREEDKLGDWALWICQNSPAQIRGYCRELRDGNRRPRQGRPRNRPKYRRSISDYQIDRCFQRVELTKIQRTRIIIPASPKSSSITH